MADIILELTTRGRALEAKIQKGDGEIPFHITRIVTGAGVSQDPTTLSHVVDIRQTFSILSREVEGFRAILRTYLDNQNVVQGYSIVQHGVYAIDPDEGEILYMISQFSHPNWMPPISERLVEFTPSFNFEVGNVSKVTFEVNPSGWQEHVSQTVHEGVHDMKTINGKLSIFDGKEWNTISPEDVVNSHNSSPQAHENRFSKQMPHAPTGAVHGAIGGRWEALEGTELRAVVMVSEEVKFSFTNRYIDIPQDQFDRFEVFYITVNGATVRIEKNPLDKRTQYAVGMDFEHYAFEYDGENMRVGVSRLGIAASNPNILHNWDFRNPVNQRGQIAYQEDWASFYNIDRWIVQANSGPIGLASIVRVMDGHIRLEVRRDLPPNTHIPIMQFIEFPELYRGKILTFTVIYRTSPSIPAAMRILASGNIDERGLINAHEWTTMTVTSRIPENATHLIPQIFFFTGNEGDYIDIQAVKLELGPVSTLANDPPPDFGTELAKCQRYQRLLSIQAGRHLHVRASRINANTIFFSIPISGNPMRIPPQIVRLEESEILVLREPLGGIQTGFNFTAFNVGTNSIRIDATKTAHGINDAVLDIQGILLDSNL